MRFFDVDKQQIDHSISNITDFKTFKSAVLQICNAYIQMSETPLTKKQKSYQSSFSRKKQVQKLESTLDKYNP